MGSPWFVVMCVVSVGLLDGIFWPHETSEGFDALARFYWRAILVTMLAGLWLLYGASRVWGAV